MKKIVLGTMLAVGMIAAGTGAASAQNLRQCVIEKAAGQLTDTQMALLKAHGDGKINILSTARDNHATLRDAARVHAFMFSAGVACALGG